MKKFFFPILIGFFMFSANTFAQLKVIGSSGKVLVGPEIIRASEDPVNAINLFVYGKGSGNSKGRIAFGDCGSQVNNGFNVIIGEYDTVDSDKLWLHGKSGIYITNSNGYSNNVVAYHTSGQPFTFNSIVKATSYQTSSDRRLKTNFKKIDSPLLNLLKLDGVKYNLKSDLNPEYPYKGVDISTLKESERAFAQNARNHAEKLKNNPPVRIGFVAQDLQKVFPELVETSEDGYLSVDYMGLIPVLIEALKEQSNTVSAQSLKIKELEQSIDSKLNNNVSSANNSTKTNTISDINNNNLNANAFLYQNTPNPFNTTTEIKYFLPEGTTNASIYVFNLQGNLLQTHSLSNNGFGSVIINGSSLNAGMYIYTLTIDGQEVETKRMILTK